MKKTNKFLRAALLLLVMSLSHALISQTFTHPGIPLSASDLATVKAHIQAGDQPWKGGYDGLASNGRSSLNYGMQGPYASVSRNPHIRRNEWMSDMTAIWNLSLMWYFTGNEQYAIKARDILLAWANTQTEFVGMEANLDLGDYAYAYGGAASILRGTWPGWTAANTTTVQNYFNNVFWPATACGGYALGPANKGALSMASGAVIAAFSDDTAKVNKIIYLMRTSAASGFPNTLPTGEIGESARDQGHAYGQWLSLAFVAEVMWKQGIDIYSYLDNRLAAVGEYFARKNLGLGVSFVPFGTTDWLYNSDGTVAWNGGERGTLLLHGAYVVRKGMQLPFVDKFRNTVTGVYSNFMFYKTSDNSTATAPAPISFPSATLTGTGLTNTDIGGATPAGSSVFNNGKWTVSGAGAEIWTHNAESFNYTYKEVTGDCSIIAKVDSISGGNTAVAKAGVMIASDLTSNPSKRAWIAITPSKTAEAYMHGWTEVRAGVNWEKQSRGISQSSYWVKIERIGDVINLYYSPDGTSWAVEAAGRFGGFTGTAYIGLAVCSLQNGTLSTATFSGVSTTGGTGGVAFAPEAPLALIVSGGNSQSTLRWVPSFGATSYTVKRATSSNGPFSDLATGVTSTNYTNTGLSNGQLYYYKVCASNSVGTSPDSKTDSVMPMSQAYITTNPSSLVLDEINATGSLTVIGADLDENVTITAPAGITVNPTTIPAGTTSNVNVSVTYDGSTAVNGNIVFTAGTTVKNVAVTANTNASCFTPLYPAGNLIVDPTCNYYTTNGWGNKSINTDPAFVYCGARSGKITANGSLDRVLTGVMRPNTLYRVKAKVYKVSGTVGIGVYGWNGTAADIYHADTIAGSWQDIDFTFTTGATLKSTGQGVFFNSGNGYIDNWEMYEVPFYTMTTSVPSLSFDELNATDSFTVSGTDIIHDITIAAPAGITVSPATIPAGTVSNVPISVTYNGTTTPVSGNITLTTGSLVKYIPVTAVTNASCFTPLYPTGNIIADPYLNSLSTFAGWGAKSINTDPAYVYCGIRSGKITGKCGGSIDYNLTGKIQSNKTYRVKAMVSTNGTGTVKIGISGATATNITQPISTAVGQWLPVDFTFTTQSTITSANMYFNSCEAQTATVGYIDNWEMYEVPTMTTSLTSMSFDDLNTAGSFTVTGTNLINDIAITAPAGITVNPTSIAAGNPTNVAVSVTYDGTTLPLGGDIALTSSGLTQNVAVSSCFAPLYSTGNLIPDPKMNSLAGFTQKWGRTSIATGSEAYCGAGSGKVTGTGICWPNGGSIATPNITWAANTTCRVRAMVKTVSGSFTIGLTNTYPVGGTANFIMQISTNNTWMQIDTTFTTGASATTGLAFFNNCEGATGLEGILTTGRYIIRVRLEHQLLKEVLIKVTQVIMSTSTKMRTILLQFIVTMFLPKKVQ